VRVYAIEKNGELTAVRSECAREEAETRRGAAGRLARPSERLALHGAADGGA
jgi:hypothetical protein